SLAAIAVGAARLHDVDERLLSRADNVVAGHQSEQAELSEVIAAGGGRRVGETPLAARRIGIALRLHLRAGDRFAEFVGHAAGDHAASRKREIELRQVLSFRDRNRPSWFERPPLSVLQRDVSRLARAQRVAAGGNVDELVSAVAIRRDDAPYVAFRREDRDLHAA